MGQSTGWQLYSASMITASATAALDGVTAGVPSNFFDLPHSSGVRIRPFSDSAANTTASQIHVHFVYAGNVGKQVPGDVVSYTTAEVCKATSGDVGTAVGVAGGHASGSQRYFDLLATVALTISDFGARILAYSNASADVFTAANGIAEILISDSGNAIGMTIDTRFGTATNINFEVRADR